MLKNVLIAGDIADKQIMKAFLTESCKNVLEKTSKCDYDGLPVMSDEDPDKQIGIIWRREINEAYQKEMEKIHITSTLATRISQSNVDNEVHFMPGHMISEIEAPNTFVGKSIGELQIRSKYGVEVISIKKTYESGHQIKAIPRADYVVTKDDRLVVAGEVENINILKNTID